MRLEQLTEPWKKRLLVEYLELEERADRLGDFLQDEANRLLMEKEEWERLEKQWDIMDTYCNALITRIRMFCPEF